MIPNLTKKIFYSMASLGIIKYEPIDLWDGMSLSLFKNLSKAYMQSPQYFSEHENTSDFFSLHKWQVFDYCDYNIDNIGALNYIPGYQTDKTINNSTLNQFSILSFIFEFTFKNIDLSKVVNKTVCKEDLLDVDERMLHLLYKNKMQYIKQFDPDSLLFTEFILFDNAIYFLKLKSFVIINNENSFLLHYQHNKDNENIILIEENKNLKINKEFEKTNNIRNKLLDYFKEEDVNPILFDFINEDVHYDDLSDDDFLELIEINYKI